ncbi:hypothetical protein Tco_0602012 [Tanacetum coccineum]
MDTLSLVSEYLKDLEECMDDGDSKVAKEEKLFDALEHKSVVIEVDNQRIVIFTKAPLRAFGEPFMSDYGRKMVNDVNVEIHGVKFKDDFVVLDYVNEGEPSIMFGRDFLTTTKSQVDFGLGEIRINLTKFKEGIEVIDLLEEVGSSSEEVVKMGKANHNKSYNINKLTPYFLEARRNSINFHHCTVTNTPSPNPKAKGENERGKERLNKKEFSGEDKVGIIEHGLPKKMCVPGNYVLLVKINGVVKMVALVDTEASVSVLPYSLYKDLGLGDPRPYQTNLTMADNTQAKAMGEVKNVRIQFGYHAYVVNLLILNILVDLELPLLLGRPFLRTCGAIIDMGRAFEMEGEDDWLGSFEVGRDEDRNVKYGSVAPSFIDIKDDMERALSMEAYFNPFKNVIVFKKLVDFLGSLPVQLKFLDWGNKGYGTYKKIVGDVDWHARFEIFTPSGRKFNQAFKTKTTTRKLSGKFKTEDVLRFSHFLD